MKVEEYAKKLIDECVEGEFSHIDCPVKDLQVELEKQIAERPELEITVIAK